MSKQPDDLSDLSPEEESGAALPLIELETLLGQPPSWRKRFSQVGLLLAVLLVVLVTYWGISRPPAPSVPVVILQPTAPPPSVSIVSNVNYGALTINGLPESSVPPVTFRVGSQPPYSITLNAPPFQPLTCQFPPLKTIAPYVFNPCNAGGVINVDQQAANTLEMLLSLANLPPSQQQQIDTLISDSLSFQQTVTAPVGSAIVTGLNPDGTLNTTLATGPLTASVFLAPSTQLPRREVYCFSFTCIGAVEPAPSSVTPANSWQVLTPIVLRWRFTTASGKVVSDTTFSSSPVVLTLIFSYDAATGWRLTPFLSSGSAQFGRVSDLLCFSGEQLLTQAQTSAYSSDGWAVNVLHDQGAAGCELALTQHGVDQGHFVWRFGALLAADATARATLPTLPAASPAELAAVGG